MVCRPSTAVGCPEKVGKMKQEDFEECKAEAIRKAEAYKKNHRFGWPPFPLPDLNSNDPWLINAACEALQTIRRNYVPDGGHNGKFLKYATDIAFDVRAAWLYNELNVENVPLAENPRWPNEQDFARLEQWFVTLAAEVARETARDKEGVTGDIVIDAGTNEQQWRDDTPEYMPNAEAIKIADGKLTGSQLNKHLRAKGNRIRWMRNTQTRRSKVHSQDFREYHKGRKTADPFSEAAFEQMEKRRNGIDSSMDNYQ